MPYWHGTNANDSFYAMDAGANQRWIAYGYSGNDALVGDGNDALYGGSGSDWIRGWGHYNALYGEDGNDLLEAHGFGFYLSGGNDHDTYLITETATIYEAPSAGTDRVLLVGNFIIDYTLPANVENVAASGEFSLYSTSSSSYTVRNNGTVTIRGNALSNMITGNTLSNTLYGGGGQDNIFGEAGDDILYGEDGGDQLTGGEGHDTLDGGAGNDYLLGYDSRWTTDREMDQLWGRTGADVFVLGNYSTAFYQGVDYANIMDFNWQEGDKFLVSGSASDYSLGYWGNTTNIYYRGDLIAFVQNTNDVLIAFDFVFAQPSSQS